MTEAGVREHFSFSCLGIMKQEARPPTHTAKAELVGTRDKEYGGYFGKIMSVHYITIKVMKRGNSENPK